MLKEYLSNKLLFSNFCNVDKLITEKITFLK